MSQPAEGPHLTFSSLNYTVTVTKDGKPTTSMQRRIRSLQLKPKMLLKEVTADVKAGHVLAILGPSGAGKTTLLNMLTLEEKGGTPIGHLHLNGHPCTYETYNKYCAVREPVSIPRPLGLAFLPFLVPAPRHC